MKILILTGHFFPELHPRAFRAAELANEFARRDHDVTVALLRTIAHHSYEQYTQKYNVKFQKLNIYKQVGGSRIFSNNYRFHWQAVLYKVYRYLLEYFMDGSLFINAKKIAKRISIRNDVDFVISLSTPFMNHLAIANYRKAFPHSNTIFVADSGDPFYRSQQTSRAPYFFYIEKYIYRAFDYLAVPSSKSIPAYIGMIDPSKLRVIPQGFNLSMVKLNEYTPSQIMNFAFCGVFYDDIRNPQFLLEYLLKVDSKYFFHIFLRHEDPVVSKMLAPYVSQMKNKIKIYYGVNRDDLLLTLSTMDFLINIDNLTTTQVPSKLIDYAIVKRPILSFNVNTFSSEKFNRFLERDYTDSLVIDVTPYDIKNVAAQFIDLTKPKNV